MGWREELQAVFPQPLPGESPALRDEIIDELADHLECAWNRERISVASDEEARQRVINQFGDLRIVTRQLWWEARKGQFVSQKLALTMTAKFAATCLIACGVMWILLRGCAMPVKP